MPTKTPKQTEAEQKLDRAQEEALANEGAPPLPPTSPLAANDDDAAGAVAEGH
jgi:hypothetical protein